MSPIHTLLRVLGREATTSSRGTGLFALVLVLIVALGALSELPQAQGPRAAATGALTPAMEAATRVDGALNGAAAWFAGNRQSAQDSARLRAENRRLAAQLARMQSIQRQNAQLRAELGLRRQDHLVTTGGMVVAHDPDGLDRTLTIDRGTASGVRPGLAVLAGGGLVGVVGSVTPASAQVETTADPALTIPVRTAVTGLGGTAAGGVPVLPVQLNAGPIPPQPAEAVVTAAGGGLPAGLPLGRLSMVMPGGRTAELTPFSDPAQASVVLVVRAVRR